MLYLRASYDLIEDAAILKVSQDENPVERATRFIIYFFIAPDAGKQYKVYRAIADYDFTTSESRVFVKAFDLYIENSSVIQKANVVAPVADLDVDIANGYITMDLKTAKADPNVNNVLKSIRSRYNLLIKNKTLQTVELLELKDGRINYKIIFVDGNGLTYKFVVFYEPNLQKILVLNAINPSQSSQFTQLS